MSHANRQLDRLEQMRQRFGWWVDLLRVRQLVTWVLARVPVSCGQRPERVRIRCWSDILAYKEIFSVGIYDSIFDGEKVSTYCDLGCQSGMALLRLVARSGAPRRSVLVDGNPLAIERCSANLMASGLKGIDVLHGAVGCRSDDGTSHVSFTIRPNELECAVQRGNLSEQGTKTVEAPIIDLESLWLQRVGDVPCDLLKMDIEGAEMGVLQYDLPFLARVRRCVMEWHEPAAPRSEVVSLLREVGFTEITNVCEGEKSGVLYCRRPAASPDRQGNVDQAFSTNA
jgi:FkbM family methyltransferase